MELKKAKTIAEELKKKAQASPWVPLGPPPRQHYHRFPNGLAICFTLDILPDARYWHLSISRVSAGGPTREEIEFWRQAFFDEEPLIELPSQLLGVPARHFHWRVTQCN